MAYGIQLTGQLPERCARTTKLLAAWYVSTTYLVSLYAVSALAP